MDKWIKKKHIVLNNISHRNHSRQKRDSKYFLGLTIEKKVESLTQHYETLLETWWDGSHKLWNITINPDYKAASGRSDQKRWGELNIKQTFKRLTAVINLILNNHVMVNYLASYIIFFELGDKNGKPHANLCIKAFKDTPDKVAYIILDGLKSYVGRNQRSTNLKDQRKLFSKPDIYNAKDATFMYKTLSVYPKEYNNAIRKEIENKNL